jgi:hypothetical protein
MGGCDTGGGGAESVTYSGTAGGKVHFSGRLEDNIRQDLYAIMRVTNMLVGVCVMIS